MQVLHLTAATRTIVAEFIAVVARQTVPCGYPDVAVIVLHDFCDGIAAQTILRREMRV